MYFFSIFLSSAKIRELNLENDAIQTMNSANQLFYTYL